MSQGKAHLLDSREAAVRIGKSLSWLNTQRSKGRGPRYVRIGSNVRYRAIDLDDFLAGSVIETEDSRRQAARRIKVAS